ncbi:MAG: hypothetical protein L6Q99_21755 [Planctomycetes bacterium]|nr:hypothetical protein [Planctomycetota bacterium]
MIEILLRIAAPFVALLGSVTSPQPSGTAPASAPTTSLVGNPLCDGNAATDTPCPCNNTSVPGEGCINGTGVGALLQITGSDDISNDDQWVDTVQMPTNVWAYTVYSTGLYYHPPFNTLGYPYGHGLRCTLAGGGITHRLPTMNTGASGSIHYEKLFSLHNAQIAPGVKVYFQTAFRDGNGPCSTNETTNFSNAWEMIFVP